MSVTNVTIPTAQSFLLVDTRTGPNKVLFLPTASTFQGRYLSIKDYYGGATNSSLTISTTGLDRIDQRGIRYILASSFGSVMLLSDGLRSWNMMGLYEGGDTALSSVTVAVSNGTVTTWKYVRFTLVLTRGQYSGIFQISEFTLKYQGSVVSYAGASITPVVGGGEGTANIIDGSLSNKAFNIGSYFTIYRESGFLFNAYTWGTANDVPDRDPVRWIVDASQDNATWTVLDNKSTADQTITTSRNTYVQDFTF